MATVVSAKRELRKRMKQILSGISDESISLQSKHVFNHILASKEYQESRTIACYVSMPSGEIQTDSIIHAALADGKALYVPRIVREPPTTDSKTQISYMQFYRIYDRDDYERNLISGVWGIREPSPKFNDLPRSTVFDQGSRGLDLILMPGMAFDREMARLGYGKGYYDQFIAKYRLYASTNGWSKSNLVALGLSEQIMEPGTIPMTEYDIHVDTLVTKGGFHTKD